MTVDNSHPVPDCGADDSADWLLEATEYSDVPDVNRGRSAGQIVVTLVLIAGVVAMGLWLISLAGVAIFRP